MLQCTETQFQVNSLYSLIFAIIAEFFEFLNIILLSMSDKKRVLSLLFTYTLDPILTYLL